LKKSFVAALLASISLAMAPLANCSDVTGEVLGPKGPVGGAQVTVADSGGNVVGQGTTNDAGRYCITGIQPGDYKTVVNPPAGAGFQGGASNRSVPAEGLTEDWSLSSAANASSSANPPGACAAAWWASGGAIGAAALLVATGAGLGACAGAGCFSGPSTHTSTPSK
jgi:Carboxypeptidase regulatory-like domain